MSLYHLFSYKLIDGFSIRLPRLFYFANSLINKLIKKKDDCWFFVPHQNCKNDYYDIFNTKSDNVLVLFESIAKEEKYSNMHLYLVYYHRDRLRSYQEFCKRYYRGAVEFVFYQDNYQFLKAFFKSKIVFTDNFYLLFPYKSKKQNVICLGYYAAPFKDDYYKIEQLGKKTNYFRSIIEKSFDYHVCTSDLSSRLISLDCLIPYSRFVSLGMPRNDVFFQNNRIFKEKLLQIIGIETRFIFIYVPTHRDYESERRKFFDKDQAVIRSIWGYESEDEIRMLDDLLLKRNAIVIVKVHPDQARNVLEPEKNKRIFLYSDIVTKIPASLNQIMAVSDCMISDYTTAAYDFLCTDRPIIYYWYDIEKYTSTRGFSINPIDSLCPGDIVYNLQELRGAMDKVLDGKDDFKCQRRLVAGLVFKEKDGCSTQRIMDFFLD